MRKTFSICMVAVLLAVGAFSVGLQSPVSVSRDDGVQTQALFTGVTTAEASTYLYTTPNHASCNTSAGCFHWFREYRYCSWGGDAYYWAEHYKKVRYRWGYYTGAVYENGWWYQYGNRVRCHVGAPNT